MDGERRAFTRKRLLRRGRIVYQNGYNTLDVVVLDLSEGGALLKMNEWFGLPSVFELRIDHGPTHKAEICFRGDGQAGVRFLDLDPA